MNSQTSSQPSFKSDYAVLQLHKSADWAAARASYRQLVHLWHPDKFIQRPAERAHAQLQFINLTKSYNSLRNFQRINGHLPFQTIASHQTRDAGKSEKPDASKPGETSHDRRGTAEDRSGRAPAAKAVKNVTAHRKNRGATWMATGALMMIATIVFLLVQDNKATKARLELGREVVRQAPPSEFLTDNVKIRKSQTREAFLKPPK